MYFVQTITRPQADYDEIDLRSETIAPESVWDYLYEHLFDSEYAAYCYARVTAYNGEQHRVMYILYQETHTGEKGYCLLHNDNERYAYQEIPFDEWDFVGGFLTLAENPVIAALQQANMVTYMSFAANRVWSPIKIEETP